MCRDGAREEAREDGGRRFVLWFFVLSSEERWNGVEGWGEEEECEWVDGVDDAGFVVVQCERGGRLVAGDGRTVVLVYVDGVQCRAGDAGVGEEDVLWEEVGGGRGER